MSQELPSESTIIDSESRIMCIQDSKVLKCQPKASECFLAALLAINCISTNTAVYCLWSFFPSSAANLGASVYEVGLTYGIFEISMALFAPMCGVLATKVGMYFAHCAGLFLVGGSNVIFGILGFAKPGVMPVILMFIIKLLQGFSQSFLKVAIFSIVAVKFPGNIDTLTGMITASVYLGNALGPTVGGWLFDVAGFGLPFFITGGAVLACLVVSLFVVLNFNLAHESRGSSKTETKHSLKEESYQLFKDHLNCILILTVLTSGLTLAFLFPSLEAHLMSFQLSTANVGAFLTLSGLSIMVTTFLTGLLINRYGYGCEVIAIGVVLNATGSLIVGPSPFLHFNSSKWLIGIAMVLIGTGFGFQLVPVFGELTRSSKKRSAQTEGTSPGSLVASMYQGTPCLSFFLGSTVGTAMARRIGFAWTATIFGITNLSFGCILVVGLIRQRRESQSPNERTSLISQETYVEF